MKVSKERLEEIEERYSTAIDIALSDGETLPEYEIEVADMNYLIQQAKEKKQLEERFETLSNIHDRTLEENQRYKQALEEIARWDEMVYSAREMGKFARQALKDDTNNA